MKKQIAITVLLFFFLFTACSERREYRLSNMSKDGFLEAINRQMDDIENYPALTEYLFLKLILDDFNDNSSSKSGLICFLIRHENSNISLYIFWRSRDNREDMIKIFLPNNDEMLIKIPKYKAVRKANDFYYNFYLFEYFLSDLPEYLKHVDNASCVLLSNYKERCVPSELIIFNEATNSFENNVLAQSVIDEWINFCMEKK